MEAIVVCPDTKEKLHALKAVLKAMDIKFEKVTSSYDPESVKKVLLGDEDIKAGRTTKISLDDINNIEDSAKIELQ